MWRRRLRQVEQPAGQPAGGQRQRVRNARDEPAGAAQNVGAQLVDGVQLECGGRPVSVVDEGRRARRQRRTGVRDGTGKRRRRWIPSGQGMFRVPVGRHRTGRFRHGVQKAHDRVEAQYVLQERAMSTGPRIGSVNSEHEWRLYGRRTYWWRSTTFWYRCKYSISNFLLSLLFIFVFKPRKKYEWLPPLCPADRSASPILVLRKRFANKWWDEPKKRERSPTVHW